MAQIIVSINHYCCWYGAYIMLWQRQGLFYHVIWKLRFPVWGHIFLQIATTAARFSSFYLMNRNLLLLLSFFGIPFWIARHQFAKLTISNWSQRMPKCASSAKSKLTFSIETVVSLYLPYFVRIPQRHRNKRHEAESRTSNPQINE